MENNNIDQQNTVTYILYGALCMSLLIYGGLILSGMLGEGGDPSITWPSEDLTSLANIPIYLAIITGTSSFFLRKWVINRDRLQTAYAKIEGDENEKKKVLFQSMFTMHILNWAINETIGVFGLVGLFLGVPKNSAIFFIVAALLMNLYMFPKIKNQINQL